MVAVLQLYLITWISRTSSEPVTSRRAKAAEVAYGCVEVADEAPPPVLWGGKESTSASMSDNLRSRACQVSSWPGELSVSMYSSVEL